MICVEQSSTNMYHTLTELCQGMNNQRFLVLTDMLITSLLIDHVLLLLDRWTLCSAYKFIVKFV